MRIKQENIYLILIVLFTAITAGIDLYTYGDIYYQGLYIQRQYGNEIKFNFLSIMVLWGLLILKQKKVGIPKKDIFSVFLFFSVVSIIFPNGQDRILSMIAIFQIVKYYLLYVILINMYTLDTFDHILRKAFVLILYIETICGGLQEFFDINIPFISSRNISAYRNGFLRIPGTFPFAAEFALFISVLLMYFSVEYFITKNQKMIKYIFLCMFDLWFAGSRTMILVSGFVIIYIIWKKNQKYLYNKMIIIFFILLFGIGFVNSSIYQKMFIENNILFMLSTRMVHWRMGFSILKENFLMGVGLNNSVSYAILNPHIVGDAYLRSIEKISFYFTNPIHNSILVMLSELGIIGGVLYICMFLKMLKSMLKNFKNKLFRKYALFVGCSGLVLLAYALQGWGVLKEFAWILIVMILAYTNLLSRAVKSL